MWLRWTWVLRPADQACAAVLVLVGLLALATRVYLGELAELPRNEAEPEVRLPVFQLDVNSAAWPEWALLPGIGETLARRIVDHRERAGGFRSLEDVRRVRGLGPKTFARLRPYLVLGSPPSPES